MARKKKSHPILQNLHVEDIAAEGKCISKTEDGKAVFTKYTAPGDIIDAQITRTKASFAEARAIKFHTYSELRVDPICDHYGLCGGCKWQHIQYKSQLDYKQQQVADNFERIGKLEFPPIAPIIGSEETYYYRNKLEFTCTNKRWLTQEEINSEEEHTREGIGFHIPGAFDKVVDVNTCHLQIDISNDIRNFIREYALEHQLTMYNVREHHGLLRNLIIRTASTGDIMLIVQFGEQNEKQSTALLAAIKERFSEITSLLYIINTKKNETFHDLDVHTYAGEPYITEEMEGLQFRIGPKSFYQTNSLQAYKLYSVARDLAALKETDVVYDLYTGTGTIANFIAKSAKQVIGVEYVPQAIEDAKVNAEINEITNTSFFAGDMKDLLTTEFIATHGQPDVIITDPPRAGMHTDVVETLLKVEAPRIVYVSCHPATQARDLELLSVKYKITAVQPVDMFPQTHHVENVVALELK